MTASSSAFATRGHTGSSHRNGDGVEGTAIEDLTRTAPPGTGDLRSDDGPPGSALAGVGEHGSGGGGGGGGAGRPEGAAVQYGDGDENTGRTSAERRPMDPSSRHRRRDHDNNVHGPAGIRIDADRSSAGVESGSGSGSGSDGSVECRWDGADDPDHPHNLSPFRKWTIVMVVSAGASCVTCTSSIYTATYGQMTREFGCSRLVATLGLSLFVMGLGIGPMLLAPLSEFYGRRPIYLVSFVLFVVFLVPSAVARNIETMLVTRFFDGLAGSAFLSVAGGSVGDMFTKAELLGPMMLYTASQLIGPEGGPLLGGFINQFTNCLSQHADAHAHTLAHNGLTARGNSRRWTFYVLLIWAGFQLVAIAALVPETYEPVLLRRRARRLRRETGNKKLWALMERHRRSKAETLRWSIVRPFQLLTLEPMCLNLCLYSALLLGLVYLFFGAFAVVFQTNHDFELHEVGLSFLGMLVGMMFGVATDPLWHRQYKRLIRAREAAGGEPGGNEPEYRLPPAVAGAVLVPIGLFWFGWTTYRSVHWIVPILGSAVFGMGALLIFSGIFTFLVDAYPVYAASALAANSFARSSFAAAFPLFGVQLYERLGYQWATSLLAFLTLVMMPFPYIFFRYGKRIRRRSRFAKT
ncbi:MAG: hypothetical protein M1815_006108 [Lichina confinis]|nr:MAG: hypothetical protein M1815_006108 [Lichina confinis]